MKVKIELDSLEACRTNTGRAYNIYDENDNLIGSYDSVDGWEFNSGYFE